MKSVAAPVRRTEPIRVEQLHDFAGATPRVGQPSVAAVLRIAGGALAAPACRRLDSLWTELLGGALPHSGGGELSLAEQIGQAAVRLLAMQGQPIFAPPAAERAGAGSLRLWLPSLRGLHALTRALLQELCALANAAIMGRPTADRARLRAVLEALRQEAPKGKNTLPMLAAADRAGIPWERMVGNIYRLGQGARQRWFDSSITDRTPNISVHLAKNKYATATVLRRQGLPVPRQVRVGNEAEALAAAAQIGYPVVVKPANTDRGLGVAAGLRDAAAVRAAYREARRYSEQILLEEHVAGNDHRLHVFDGQVYRVRHRQPGGVTGDGRSSIEQLLRALNADPARGPEGSGADLVAIPLDEEALALVREAGMQPDSVPAAGQFVQLRRIANVSVGGVSAHVALEQVHPDNLVLAVRAVRALKLDLAAVDLLIPDIGRSWMEGGAAICEVNAQPQFGEDAPDWIFARMFDGRGRVPTVAVVGAPAAADWIAQLRSRAQASGICLGYCDADGAWIGAQRVAPAPPGGVFQAGALLAGDEQVGAILMLADASLLQQGLPVDRLDALVLAGGAAPQPDAELAQWLSPRSRSVLVEDQAAPRWLPLRERIRCSEMKQVAAEPMGAYLLEVLSA